MYVCMYVCLYMFRRAGNFFFWFGLILGVPLLATLYCREYYYALSLKHDALPPQFI
jgi:hypothetical protein